MNTLQRADQNPAKSLQNMLDKELLRLEMISLVDYETEELGMQQAPEIAAPYEAADEPQYDTAYSEPYEQAETGRIETAAEPRKPLQQEPDERAPEPAPAVPPLEELPPAVAVKAEPVPAPAAKQQETKQPLPKPKRTDGKKTADFTQIETLEELLDSNKLASAVKTEINLMRANDEISASEVIKNTLAIFNLLDQLRQPVEKQDKRVQKQVKTAVSQSLALLREMGVHEVDVYGQFIDEDYMELAGTVPAADAPKGLQKFQVAVIERRAFSFEETGTIIQYAIVKTVA